MISSLLDLDYAPPLDTEHIDIQSLLIYFFKYFPNCVFVEFAEMYSIHKNVICVNATEQEISSSSQD